MRFSYVSTASAALVFAVAEAGSHSLPITRTSLALHFTEPGFFQQPQSNQDQSALASPSRHLSQLTLRNRDTFVAGILQKARSQSLAQDELDDDDDLLDAMYWSIYTTPISVGNPPLKLTATVDSSWSTLFVPSVNCTYNPNELKYCLIHPLYNSSLSSTYHADLTPSSVLYTGPAGLHTWGNVSQDSIHVAGMEIKGQIFEEATIWHPDISTRDDLFDTALGLALFPARNGDRPGDFSASSPFHNMIQQKLLDENIVSLKLARTDNETGEMVLGGLPQNLRREELIKVSLDHSKTDDSDHIWRYYTMNGWQVSVESMSMAFNRSEASTPVLEKSQIAVHIIIVSMDWHVFDWIDCEERQNLPNWTIVFGPDEQAITLTPWDYLIEMHDKLYKQLKCVSGFYNLSRYGDKGFIILGATFLNGLNSVFDADRKSISFGKRPL
ncbi:acid protease [Zopfia rhizophila CBS 207.26]|uniref:Acid protease n=1 Tax=Zopfia rhizophila CBS 207.26 TaxID=1314779 RepID=A0A6A6DS47_9PEZI|nr:acid protease [Zopfia rhizophila CBS 207.26]